MNKDSNPPIKHLLPNHKLTIRRKMNGDVEYILRPLENEDDYSSVRIFATLFVLVVLFFLMFGSRFSEKQSVDIKASTYVRE